MSNVTSIGLAKSPGLSPEIYRFPHKRNKFSPVSASLFHRSATGGPCRCGIGDYSPPCTIELLSGFSGSRQSHEPYVILTPRPLAIRRRRRGGQPDPMVEAIPRPATLVTALEQTVSDCSGTRKFPEQRGHLDRCDDGFETLVRVIITRSS